MAQSLGLQGGSNPKEIAEKYGVAIASAIGLFGMLIILIGYVLTWVKLGDVKVTGIDLLFKGGSFGIGDTKDAAVMFVRGSSYNALLCNVPFYVCSMGLLMLVMAMAPFWKKVPSMTKLVGPIALGVLTLFSCCPAILLLIDLGNDKWKGSNIKPDAGVYVVMAGLFFTFLGALVGIGASIWTGGFPKRNKRVASY